MPTNEELVRLARNGDRASFAELIRRHERLVLGTAWETLGDWHAAQDVAQDAFLVAFRRLSTLRNPGAFRPWVVQIAARLAVRQVERKPPERLLHADIETDPPPDCLDDEIKRVLAAVSRLPEGERSAVMLRYVEGNDVSTVARLSGRPLGTVTKQLSRAITRLRQMLVEVEP
jgi:RNA polymerase sigma-70 factor (ECF subfamily)